MPADVAADGESYPLTEIDRAIDKMVKDRAWGQIQIDFQHGRPVVVRTTVTENLKANEENKLYEYRKRQNIGTDTF